jgi:protein disulfide-isomerase
MPSRTSILETIPLVISNSPKLKSKSTVGIVESVFFQTRSFISSHRFFSLFFFASLLGIAAHFARRTFSKRKSVGGYGGILGGSTTGGFFKLDGKEGLLNGGAMGKVD